MESIGMPRVQESMRVPPVVPIERIDSFVHTSANYSTYCRLYYTPQLSAPLVKHPGIPPTPPTAPRPLPPRKKGDTAKSRQTLRKHYNTKVANYNIILGIYETNKATWDVNYKEYINSLDLNRLDCKTEGCDKDEKEEDDHDDPIAAAEPLVVFTHGRNSTLEDAHITAFCQGFGREAAILLFEDSRPELQRIHVFRTLVNSYPSIKAFSGRSAGARNAARASIHTPVRRLIFFTYPLVRDLNYRYADLLALDPNIEVLFVVGDGDPLAVETHLREVRHRMRAKSWWIKLIKGNHTFNMWTKEEIENTLDIAGQIAAVWAKTENLDPDLSELRLQTKFETGKAEWTGWQPPEPETPKPATYFNVQVEGGKIPNGGGSFQFTLPGSGSKRKGNNGKGRSK